MAPRDPELAIGGARMAYVRVTTVQPEEVDAATRTADVIVTNWGLHYRRMQGNAIPTCSYSVDLNLKEPSTHATSSSCTPQMVADASCPRTRRTHKCVSAHRRSSRSLTTTLDMQTSTDGTLSILLTRPLSS